MRKALVLGFLTSAVTLSAFVATPASEAQTVAFTVLDGTLAITPGTPAGSVNSSLVSGVTTATVSLGLTTVADTRIGSAGWTVSAGTTDFTLTPGTATITKANAKFSVPVAPVVVLGNPTFTRVSTPTAVDGSGYVTGLVVAVATGVNTGTFIPQLDITVPNGSTAGLYTGTVTQSAV